MECTNGATLWSASSWLFSTKWAACLMRCSIFSDLKCPAFHCEVVRPLNASPSSPRRSAVRFTLEFWNPNLESLSTSLNSVPYFFNTKPIFCKNNSKPWSPDLCHCSLGVVRTSLAKFHRVGELNGFYLSKLVAQRMSLLCDPWYKVGTHMVWKKMWCYFILGSQHWVLHQIGRTVVGRSRTWLASTTKISCI